MTLGQIGLLHINGACSNNGVGRDANGIGVDLDCMSVPGQDFMQCKC